MSKSPFELTNNLSNYINKIISLNELKEQIIYMPRKTSITTQNFLKSVKLIEDDFKNILGLKNLSLERFFSALLMFVNTADAR